jgi:hypothetical protein
VKLHWRVVCAAGFPEMLWNLQGWSSITSMVYLSLLNLSPLALLASTCSPRASLNSDYLLGAVLVVTVLIFPLAMSITVVMSS